MNEYWSQKARGLTPYVAGEQPDEPLIKLNTNENPYPPSPKVGPAVASAAADLRLYPPADGGAFRDAAAAVNGLSREEVFCSNGSDEALALCFAAFFDPETPVRTLDITYSFYPVWANLFGLTLETAAVSREFLVDVDAMTGSQGAVLANPNAPTGMALGERQLRRIIEGTQGVCIIDEAYEGFGAVSAVPWIREYPNLAVVRTLSKSYGLAGVRAGYVCAQPELIEALQTVKNSFNSYPVDRLAIAAATAALEDQEYHANMCERIVFTRGGTARALEDFGYSVLPSAANFLFVHCLNGPAIFEKLREQGVLVRHFGAKRTRNWLRVTIGTDRQMDRFLEIMKKARKEITL